MSTLLTGLSHMLSAPFMVHALIAGGCIALASGLVGYFLVLRNQVFTGDALSHVAFTGTLLALTLGIDLRIGLYLGCLVVGLAMALLARRGIPDDVIIGNVFSFILGLGVFLLTFYSTHQESGGNGTAGINVLFGSILGLSGSQALFDSILAIGVIVLLLVLGRPLLFASIDAVVAEARGIPVRSLGVIFLAIVGITAGEATQAVGALLLLGLLAAPAAAAQAITRHPLRAMTLSAIFALVAVWLGLAISCADPSLPTSFSILSVVTLTYIVVAGGMALRQRCVDRRTLRHGDRVPAEEGWIQRGVEGDSTLVRRLIANLLVTATTVVNLVLLWPEHQPVAYLNDSALHSEMVRFATQQIRAGHLPLTGWFPYLGEGSPLFLHYQSLGATIGGALGLAIGPDNAFAWLLYLLLATWPISVYLGVRWLGWSRLAAALAAVLSPFVMSTLGIGYEQRTYLTIGYGLWSQLFAMWTLPLAWGLAWRAMQSRRHLLGATLAISATIAFHFLTGYLAIAGIGLAFAASATPLRVRLRRCGELIAGVVLTSAWVVVPLIGLSNYSSINEFLQHGPDVNSYGARQALAWLLTGALFDANRPMVLTVFVLLGLVLIIWRSATEPRARYLLLLFLLSLLLFFGPTTFSLLPHLVPGGHDLFFRRFLMGVQLAGLIAAGIVLAWCWERAQHVARWAQRELALGTAPRGTRLLITLVSAAIGLAVLVAPMWGSLTSTTAAEAQNISTQRAADMQQGAQIAPLIADITRLGGRVYAGLPVPPDQLGGWGSEFQVGAVPVFKYLASQNIDEVGFTLRTSSLMTDPEVYFDEDLPADYPLFGIRWLLYPAGRIPIVPAHLVLRSGPYLLYELPTAGLLQLVTVQGAITANRGDIGLKTADFVRSARASVPVYPALAYAGHPALPATGAPLSGGKLGSVNRASIDLVEGHVSASVMVRRTSVLLLKVSYDPGWHATVDGHSVPTAIIAPAYIGIRLSPGAHLVTLTYAGGGGAGPLLVLAALTILLLLGLRYWQGRASPADIVKKDRD